MASPVSFSYFFFLTVNTLAMRNAVQPRRWGMQVTITDDAVPGNNTTWVLVKNLADADINNNNNWQTLSAYIGAVAGGGWDRLAVNVVPANLALNMGNVQLREFIPSANITAPKTWVVSNAGNAFEFRFIFTLTGAFAQTLPANFEMADPMFNNATKVWTPADAGTYEAKAVFNGTNWFLEITGLFV